jgi:hypothetical protein
MAFNSPGADGSGGTRIPGGQGKDAVTPPERALICAYAGVGLDAAEIGGRLDRDQKVIREVLDGFRDRARAADDPLDVYADVIGPALAADPDVGGGD